ncbi:MAG: hypothetical protein ACFBQW_02250 [Sphingomonadaceae bacterium]
MKSQHEHKSTQHSQNQNNKMSKRQLRDGSRNSKTLGRQGEGAHRSPERAEQEEPSTVEAFGEEGAGVDAKE